MQTSTGCDHTFVHFLVSCVDISANAIMLHGSKLTFAVTMAQSCVLEGSKPCEHAIAGFAFVF